MNGSTVVCFRAGRMETHPARQVLLSLSEKLLLPLHLMVADNASSPHAMRQKGPSGLTPYRRHGLTWHWVLGRLSDVLPPRLGPPVLASELPQAHADVLLLLGYGVAKPGVLCQR